MLQTSNLRQTDGRTTNGQMNYDTDDTIRCLRGGGPMGEAIYKQILYI